MRDADLALTAFLAHCMKESSYSTAFSARIRKLAPGSEERFLFRGRFLLNDMHIKHEDSGLSVWMDSMRSSKAQIYGSFRLSRPSERDHVLRIQYHFSNPRFEVDFDGQRFVGFFESQQRRISLEHTPNDANYSFILGTDLASSFVT